MPDDERDASGLSPEEIARRACAIVRSLEGMQKREADLVLGLARAYLERAESDPVRFPVAPPLRLSYRLNDTPGDCICINGKPQNRVAGRAYVGINVSASDPMADLCLFHIRGVLAALRAVRKQGRSP